MVFVCAGSYFLGFVLLRRRLATGLETGTRCDASLPVELWLLGLVVVAGLAYAFDYAQAVKSTQALALIGAAMMGQGAGLWAEWERGSPKSKVQSPKSPERMVVAVLAVLLLGAAVWQAEAGHLFQYRGQGRWSGPWDNPNTFGMLMGVGAALAVGLLVQSPKPSKCGVRGTQSKV
jgi:hypothetical protein